jgi:hypothetical protein
VTRELLVDALAVLFTFAAVLFVAVELLTFFLGRRRAR